MAQLVLMCHWTANKQTKPVPPSVFCSYTFPLSEAMARKLEFWKPKQASRYWAKSECFNLYRLPRRDEMRIHRLRIGHSFITHGHLLRGETCPRCSACDVDLTVEHILLHRVSFAIARDHSFNMTVTTLSEWVSLSDRILQENETVS